MVGSHLGHNAEIGDHNVLANQCMLGGYVHVGNRTFLGGGAGFHQFCRVGDMCMVQGNAAVNQDVPPYTICARASEIWGLNVIGMRRAKFSPETRNAIKRAFDLVYRSGHNLSQALGKADEDQWEAEAAHFLDFFRNPSRRGISRLTKST